MLPEGGWKEMERLDFPSFFNKKKVMTGTPPEDETGGVPVAYPYEQEV